MLLDESKLEEKDFKYTYTEILNQADTWLEVYNLYEKRKNDIENFLKKVGKDCKVIFTGAGTSEYVGNIALDYLKTHGEFEFESVADDFYNLPITCAKEGKLAQALKDDENSYVFLEPEITNDKGFAMTNSFSSMLLATLLIFDTKTKNKKEIVEKISKLGKEIYNNLEEIENLVNFDFNRVVYLGSGPLGKLTKEARLKILELTAGEVATIWESSMGFRHELIFEEDGLDDVYLCPAYIIIGQIIALVTSLRVGNTPDNPSRTHTVNRVVKGVTIHDYKN